MTVGIIGVGNIGKEVIRLLKPFNPKVLVNDIIDQGEYYKTEGVEEVSKEEMMKRADLISLHVPLTEETERMINNDNLALMKQGVYIVNTARGGLLDYKALKDALKGGRVAGAAIDVYDEEPPTDRELLSFDQVVNTPHIGGNSSQAVRAMGQAAIDNLKNFYK
jgi:phosphoglycerate dehydrogenase-like enzyme